MKIFLDKSIIFIVISFKIRSKACFSKFVEIKVSYHDTWRSASLCFQNNEKHPPIPYSSCYGLSWICQTSCRFHFQPQLLHPNRHSSRCVRASDCGCDHCSNLLGYSLRDPILLICQSNQINETENIIKLSWRIIMKNYIF